MEVDIEVLSEIIECTSYHKKLVHFGERIWFAEGKECDVVYFDKGNGCCIILQILPKGDEKCLKTFEKYTKLISEAMSKIENE